MKIIKIVFLCGSLEPGRDGVGDYTRMLSANLIRQGHSASIIAIKDPYINDYKTNYQEVGDIKINVLRISTSFSNKKMQIYLNDGIKSINPDWISLQFVPYGFQMQGLPFYLINVLRKHTVKRKLHVMLHETWLGKDEHPSIKGQIISFLQKGIIYLILKILNPRLIHTHLPLHKRRIKNLGFDVKELPLFSNIPFSTSFSPPTKSPMAIRVGFFSQVSHQPQVLDFLLQLHNRLKAEESELEILLIGGKKKKNKAFIDHIVKSVGIPYSIKTTGFLDERGISLAIQSCNLAISPVPRHALGKSGSIAAFLLHGIPIAAPIVNKGKDPLDIGFFSHDLRSSILLEPNLKKLKNSELKTAKFNREISVENITLTYLKDLELYN